MSDEAPPKPTGAEALACVRIYNHVLGFTGVDLTKTIVRGENTPEYFRQVAIYGVVVTRLALMTNGCALCGIPYDESSSAHHWCDQREQALRARLIHSGVMDGDTFDALGGSALAVFLRAWMDESAEKAARGER